jgi:hypothetical protein
MQEMTTLMPKGLHLAYRGSVPSSLRFSLMTLEQRLEMCKFMAGSTSIPKALQGNPANIYYVAERGDRIGLSMTESISCVYVVNGVTALWGDIPLALCRASECWDGDYFEEWLEVNGQRVDKTFDNVALHAAYEAKKSIIAYCQSKRTDSAQPLTRSYSLGDAVLQELDKKDTWHKSTKRMLQRRARALNLADNFGDVLYGLASQETAEDATLDPVADDLTIKSQPATKGAAIQQLPDVDTLTAPPILTPKPEQKPEPCGAVTAISDNEWLDLCIFWKDSRKHSLAKACAEFDVISVDDIPPAQRQAFRDAVQKHVKTRMPK